MSQPTSKSQSGADEKAPEILVLSLVDRQDSEMILEGSEDLGMPIRMDCPAKRFILNTSHMVKGDEVIPIRYIKAAPTIIREEQDERGFRPNPTQDQIVIEGGTMTIVKSPLSATLYDFMKNTADNEDAPYRPKDRRPIFREIKAQQVANDNLEIEEQIHQAKGTVLSLRSKNARGGFDYDIEQINFLSLLFNIMGVVETPEEKMAVLLSIAESRSEYFNNTIADRTSATRGDVLMAQRLSVLSIDKGEASLMETGQKIFKSRSKEKDAQLNDLIFFLMSEKGDATYQNLLLSIEAAKAKAAAGT